MMVTRHDVTSYSVASAIILLMLLQPFLVAAFQQNPLPLSYRQDTTFCPRITSIWPATVASETADITEDRQQVGTDYDWDEQFEKLLLFKKEYGHCNFPQNAPAELSEKYPTLARFCQDQRKKSTKRKSLGQVVNLKTFDRRVRHRRLEEIGFEPNAQLAQWYDKFHELLEYQKDHGHLQVMEKENRSLTKFVRYQRGRRKGWDRCSAISESEIKLLDGIGFEWESEFYDTVWMANYNELVEYRNKNGHCLLKSNDKLFRWAHWQRRRRKDIRKQDNPLSEEQIKLLDDIDFPWKSERFAAMWYDHYTELEEFQQKHGHCRPTTSHPKLCDWSRLQRSKRNKDLLSTEQIDLLDEIGFPWQNQGKKMWNTQHRTLAEYYCQHGHLRVSEDDDPELYEWTTTERKRYHGIITNPAITDQQIEMMEEFHFCWSLDWKERIWHEKYTEVVEFYKEHGHTRVKKKANPSVYNWIQSQEKRYTAVKGQKPLSEEELELLEQVDFPFLDDQPRTSWNARYAALERYLDENDGQFPNHKDDPGLNRWMRDQRKRLRSEHGYVALSEEQKSLLEGIQFPTMPKSRQLIVWYEKYEELVEFWNQHGHFAVDRYQHTALHRWSLLQRTRCNSGVVRYFPLSLSQKYLLDRIDFAWVSDRKEVDWQSMFEELVQFQKEHGHMNVHKSKNKHLYSWRTYQRTRYKGNEGFTKLSPQQIEQLESIGFHWEDKE